eukprot:CAMPEP_0197867964 /NCGR_PEP_ID=MMETSP1438-20131217/45033_1 /TAXON_ID=1461541 /ORGANISM="Pterosperma sp., Strain CCMP1384" /LENGTH=399 /DNA_ID=CAMNT_0043486641 /DNA_START=669 /DNA_END=1868 /DNA_ORIENTATION=+
MYFGKPSAFYSPQAPSLKNITPLQAAHNAEAVVEWINQELGTEFKLETDTTYGDTYNALGPSNSQDLQPKLESPPDIPKPLPNKVDLLDVEKATILSIEYMFTAGVLTPQNRASFLNWVDLIATAHPVLRCRNGAKGLQRVADDVWPEGGSPRGQLQTWRVCGKDSKAATDDWRSCKGSLESTRGYSCGLWQLFHTLAANMDKSDLPRTAVGKKWLNVIRQFISVFFMCDECRTHFLQMAGTDEALTVKSYEEAVLWMWKAHNVVNIRLATEEAETRTGDPEFPKQYWPSKTVCPRCYSADTAEVTSPTDEPAWNIPEVLAFNLYFYGNGPMPGDLNADTGSGSGGRKGLPGTITKGKGGILGAGVHVFLVLASGVGLMVSALYWVLASGGANRKNRML